MKLMASLEKFTHRKCRTAMAHMRADLIEMNGDRAQMAHLLREERQRADALAEKLEAIEADA